MTQLVNKSAHRLNLDNFHKVNDTSILRYELTYSDLYNVKLGTYLTGCMGFWGLKILTISSVTSDGTATLDNAIPPVNVGDTKLVRTDFRSPR